MCAKVAGHPCVEITYLVKPAACMLAIRMPRTCGLGSIHSGWLCDRRPPDRGGPHTDSLNFAVFMTLITLEIQHAIGSNRVIAVECRMHR